MDPGATADVTLAGPGRRRHATRRSRVFPTLRLAAGHTKSTNGLSTEARTYQSRPERRHASKGKTPDLNEIANQLYQVEAHARVKLTTTVLTQKGGRNTTDDEIRSGGHCCSAET